MLWQRVQVFSWPVCSIICKGGESVLIMRETLRKNNLNSKKDVPMICVYFITIVFSEKKGRKQYLCTAPCCFHTYHMCIGALVALRDFSIETFSNQNILCIF